MTNQKPIIAFLLQGAALKLMAASPVRDRLQKEAEAAYNRLRAKYSATDIKGVDYIASILNKLVGQMAACESIDELEKVSSFVQAIIDAKVYIVPDNQELIMPE